MDRYKTAKEIGIELGLKKHTVSMILGHLNLILNQEHSKIEIRKRANGDEYRVPVFDKNSIDQVESFFNGCTLDTLKEALSYPGRSGRLKNK